MGIVGRLVDHPRVGRKVKGGGAGLEGRCSTYDVFVETASRCSSSTCFLYERQQGRNFSRITSTLSRVSQLATDSFVASMRKTAGQFPSQAPAATLLTDTWKAYYRRRIYMDARRLSSGGHYADAVVLFFSEISF